LPGFGWHSAFQFLDEVRISFLNDSGGPVILKNVFTTLICATLFAWSGLAVADEHRADEYQADEFLGLDLSTAVLSPKRLGPSSEFTPVAVEAKADRDVETAPAPARATRVTHPKVRVARLPKQKRHAVAQVRSVPRHTNPLDAQALDTRIQAWPCKSGGICNWKR
jgi:hypothetical protein